MEASRITLGLCSTYAEGQTTQVQKIRRVEKREEGEKMLLDRGRRPMLEYWSIRIFLFFRLLPLLFFSVVSVVSALLSLRSGNLLVPYYRVLVIPRGQGCSRTVQSSRPDYSISEVRHKALEQYREYLVR